jgi:transcriptional regulator with XRE-family HTH domain
MNEFGNYVRKQREKKNFSLGKLAVEIGVSRQYLYRIELGEARASVAMCLALAKLLELDSDVLLLMAGHTPPDVLTILQENPQASCAILRRAML